MSEVRVGSQVRLLRIQQWLIHDLPIDEAEAICSMVGGVYTVESIDVYGYAWIGGGVYSSGSEGDSYQGHSFCVPPDDLELLSEHAGQ